jgi:hypothetical protein
MSFVFAEALPTGSLYTPLEVCFKMLAYLQDKKPSGAFSNARVSLIEGVELQLWYLRDENIHIEDFCVILNLGLTMDAFLKMTAELVEEQASNVVVLNPIPLHIQLKAVMELRGLYGDAVTRVHTSDANSHLTVLTFPDAAQQVRDGFNAGLRGSIKSI